ncbi:excinuclease ABC subunit UvrB [Candidatus Gottesmanbacteria bacterium]|nr:excinuclease ABC subunit UvrB [Candidatus Gottesmanbacteria bacterium]
MFQLKTDYHPSGDQPQAIEKLSANIASGQKEQVLLGVTGSGKTFTMAKVIESMKRPTLIISHNKTLAAQLYQEFRDFFPQNAVSYFVSYYDYYQPEAYIPQTDTFIEKETQINEEIDKLRLGATANILTRPDTIVVASVSCIYNIGSPKEYGHFVLELAAGMNIRRESILTRLVDLQYERNNYGFTRSTFRVRGESIDLFPAYDDLGLRMTLKPASPAGGLDKLVQLVKFDPLTGKTVEELPSAMIYPAKHYMTDPRTYASVFEQIRRDMETQAKLFTSQAKLLEANRLRQRVTYDLEMIQELGYVNGIENYSRYFDGRKPGEAPFTLLDYFEEATRQSQALNPLKLGFETSKDWLLFIDESHMTVPQIRGMYNGDRSRKQTLIDFGFRLPSAIDNRPLRFEEFLRKMPQTVYVSATPDEWEVARAKESAVPLSLRAKRSNLMQNVRSLRRGNGLAMTGMGVVEQLVRPTGLVDPIVEVRPTHGQIDDLLKEIKMRTARKERVLVTTLTKRMAEDLSAYLEKEGIKVHYLHSDVETFERSDILDDLRRGTYDVVVGINLLREGLDLPEVSLVVILDADKEGFLRSRTSLIQTMGRASRHLSGTVIMYADRITDSMKAAIEEVKRRRTVQLAYNKAGGITPTSITKPIRDRLVEKAKEEVVKPLIAQAAQAELDRMTPQDKKKLIVSLTKAMRRASRDLDFESAARLRDTIEQIS